MKKLITIITVALLLAGGASAQQIFGGINSAVIAEATNLVAGTVVNVVDLINGTNVNATNIIGVITNVIKGPNASFTGPVTNTGASVIGTTLAVTGMVSAVGGITSAGNITGAVVKATALDTTTAHFTGPITNEGAGVIGTTLAVTGLVNAIGGMVSAGPITNNGALVVGTTACVTGMLNAVGGITSAGNVTGAVVKATTVNTTTYQAGGIAGKTCIVTNFIADITNAIFYAGGIVTNVTTNGVNYVP